MGIAKTYLVRYHDAQTAFHRLKPAPLLDLAIFPLCRPTGFRMQKNTPLTTRYL
jgi:hypothetical protein